MRSTVATIPNCIRDKRGSLTLYKGSFPSDIATKIAQVHVFEVSRSNYVHEIVELHGNEGYQRPATKSRQNDFAEYLRNKTVDQTFSPPIVLNARGLWSFRPRVKTGEFGTLHIGGIANIIDGQHRLGGFISHFQRTGDTRPVDFVAYDNLDSDQEKWVFHTINTNQKGVAGALSVIIDDGKWYNRVARDIAEKSSSPFIDRISKAGSAGPKYLWKLDAVAKNVRRMFLDGTFEQTPEESRFDMFVKYWGKIRDTHTEAWMDFERPKRQWRHKLLELTGLIAYCRLFRDTFKKYYNAPTDTVDWSAIEKDLDELAGRLDLRKEGTFQGRTGEYGGNEILQKMQAILAQPTRDV